MPQRNSIGVFVVVIGGGFHVGCPSFPTHFGRIKKEYKDKANLKRSVFVSVFMGEMYAN
jgi:hypothetical protein